MVLMRQKIIRRLAKHSVFIETVFGEVLRVLGDDCVRARHDGSG
jgi:hypothetical protein